MWAGGGYGVAEPETLSCYLRQWSRVSGICCFLSTNNFVHNIPIIHYSCKLADHQVTHADSEMRCHLSYNRQVMTLPALTSAVMYEVYSESKYRFAVKKSSKVSYKILLLSDFTFFKLFFHIFAAIIEALIVAGQTFLYTPLVECGRLRC